MTDRSLLYLYGIAEEDAPPPADLGGVDGEPVQLVPLGGAAAIVSSVAAAAYAEAELEARLADLPWVGERGLAHERVLSWFADRGPVVPLTPFSLHQDEARLRERLAPLLDRFRGTLERLRGQREYGVRLWRTDAVAAHLRELSPRVRTLEDEMAAATPGRRFLLQKKHQQACREEARTAAATAAHAVFDALARDAGDAARLPVAVPPQGEGVRALVLHAAFLVADQAYPAFRDAVAARAAEFGALGFELEFTGPWPPYHFADR